MEHSPLIPTAKKLDTLFLFLQRICLIAIVLFLCFVLILTVVNLVNPNTHFGSFFPVACLGPVSIEVSPQHCPSNQSLLMYVWISFILGCVCSFFIYLSLHYLRAILSPMKEGNPFHSDTCLNLRRLAWVSLALGAIQNVWGTVGTFAMVRLYDLSQLSSMGSVTIHADLDGTFLIIFFILLLLSYVFRYGAALQEFSDEAV